MTKRDREPDVDLSRRLIAKAKATLRQAERALLPRPKPQRARRPVPARKPARS